MAEGDQGGRTRPDTGTRCTYRGPDDDFYCLRYQVWYPSFDCALRTLFATFEGCSNCDQGRFNLKRHRPQMKARQLRRLRRLRRA